MSSARQRREWPTCQDVRAEAHERTERFRQRLQRRLRKAGASPDRARATAERLVPRPRGRHGIVRRTWARLVAAVRRHIDRFAARQAINAQLADAHIERVLGSRRRLGNAIDTATGWFGLRYHASDAATPLIGRFG